jgi:hypothetical protein
VAEADSMVAAGAFTVVEADSTVVAEAFTAVEVGSVAALAAGGTMRTAVVFVAEPRRAWVAHTGDLAGTRLVHMAIPLSVAECDPVRTA